jgi:hypothetical protein
MLRSNRPNKKPAVSKDRAPVFEPRGSRAVLAAYQRQFDRSSSSTSGHLSRQSQRRGTSVMTRESEPPIK